MTNEQILKQAIEKAIKNGYKPIIRGFDYSVEALSKHWIGDNMEHSGKWYYEIIFSHDFAKAIWGEREISSQDILKARGSNCRYFWQYHLQRMVLEKNPLAHLREFL